MNDIQTDTALIKEEGIHSGDLLTERQRGICDPCFKLESLTPEKEEDIKFGEGQNNNLSSISKNADMQRYPPYKPQLERDSEQKAHMQTMNQNETILQQKRAQEGKVQEEKLQEESSLQEEKPQMDPIFLKRIHNSVIQLLCQRVLNKDDEELKLHSGNIKPKLLKALHPPHKQQLQVDSFHRALLLIALLLTAVLREKWLPIAWLSRLPMPEAEVQLLVARQWLPIAQAWLQLPLLLKSLLPKPLLHRELHVANNWEIGPNSLRQSPPYWTGLIKSLQYGEENTLFWIIGWHRHYSTLVGVRQLKVQETQDAPLLRTTSLITNLQISWTSFNEAVYVESRILGFNCNADLWRRCYYAFRAVDLVNIGTESTFHSLLSSTRSFLTDFCRISKKKSGIKLHVLTSFASFINISNTAADFLDSFQPVALKLSDYFSKCQKKRGISVPLMHEFNTYGIPRIRQSGLIVYDSSSVGTFSFQARTVFNNMCYKHLCVLLVDSDKHLLYEDTSLKYDSHTSVQNINHGSIEDPPTSDALVDVSLHDKTGYREAKNEDLPPVKENPLTSVVTVSLQENVTAGKNSTEESNANVNRPLQHSPAIRNESDFFIPHSWDAEIQERSGDYASLNEFIRSLPSEALTQKDAQGRTICHALCSLCHHLSLAGVEHLPELLSGQCMACQDSSGNTPLHCAIDVETQNASTGTIESILALVPPECLVIRNADSCTPLDLAFEKKLWAPARMLAEHQINTAAANSPEFLQGYFFKSVREQGGIDFLPHLVDLWKHYCPDLDLNFGVDTTGRTPWWYLVNSNDVSVMGRALQALKKHSIDVTSLLTHTDARTTLVEEAVEKNRQLFTMIRKVTEGHHSEAEQKTVDQEISSSLGSSRASSCSSLLSFDPSESQLEQDVSFNPFVRDSRCSNVSSTYSTDEEGYQLQRKASKSVNKIKSKERTCSTPHQETDATLSASLSESDDTM